ncbi:MAG: DnaD domain protein [Thermomicrobiales bacterium]
MGNSADYRIATGLDLAVGRGVLLRFRTIEDQHERVWYTIATPEAKSAIDRMLQGESLPHARCGKVIQRRESNRSAQLFRLYEQNIGLLSPIIADQLVRAMERYPREWIEDAIGEAVAYNRRNWRYIQRILQNWATTGRSEDRPETTSDDETNWRRVEEHQHSGHSKERERQRERRSKR